MDFEQGGAGESGSQEMRARATIAGALWVGEAGGSPLKASGAGFIAPPRSRDVAPSAVSPQSSSSSPTMPFSSTSRTLPSGENSTALISFFSLLKVTS